MAQKVMAMIKLQIPAGQATPGQPVGPALGQHGVNIMQFVKEYNARTANQAGDIVPAEITVLHGSVVHVRHQDAAGADAAEEGSGHRERQLRTRSRTRRARSRGAKCARSRSGRWTT